MDHDELAKRLLVSFVEELTVHVAALDRDLLALERADGAASAELLHALFRTIHTVKGASRSASVHPVEQTAHRIEDVLSKLRDGSLTATPTVFEVLFGVTDALRDAGARLARGESLEDSTLQSFIDRLTALGDSQPVAPALAPAARGPGPSAAPALRVTADRLDALLGTASELSVAIQRLDDKGHELSHVRSLVRELDASLKQLRMVRFAEACLGLDRALRDVARAGGKEAKLVVIGEDVQLDRDVVEGLRDSLVQLVRNAVDHGIEAPGLRTSIGKPAHGTVTIEASLRGAEVFISITDDGRGIDVEAIRANLKKRTAEPSPNNDIVQSIFVAGFSTARIVTDVSGRGVGLDIVKRSVESLMGAIDLSFRAGIGSSFSLRVPVTRTSMRGLLVRAAGRTWVLPGISVKRLMRVAADEIKPVAGVDTVSIDGAPVPIFPLALAVGGDSLPQLRDAKANVVVVNTQGSDVALVVDELLEEREVVVKPLGPRLAASNWVSGATVLPTGRLSLILNVASIVTRSKGAPVGAPLFEATALAAHVRTILLVDDSLTTRILERSILESAGYTVLVASDGAEAWRLLQERGADLIVSDIEMPVMDGFALTDAVRKSARFRDLPVVLVTALASDEHRARGLDLGASAYLVKSAFDQKNLLETIAQLL